MAPEQAAGRTHEVGPLSDVYALGAILYELLTGKAPFQGRTIVESLQQILTQPPVRPRRLVRSVPRGLESICLNCLEKKPRRRYQSAQALADDLERWIDGKRPQADQVTARAGRFLRWHPILDAAAIFLVLVAVIAPVAAYLLNPERQRERIERDLRAGKEVYLIGDEGPPKWHDWATNEATQKYLIAQDEAFRLVSEGFGLLELVRDPQHSRYRFSAWMRHDENFHAASTAGLYFEYGKQCNPGTEHRFCAVSFNGLTDFRRRYAKLKGSPGTLAFRRLVEADRNEISRDICSLALPVDWHPLPVWRQIAVEVSPEKIRFTLSWPTETGWESATTEVIREEVQKVKNSAFVPPELIGVPSDLPGPQGSLGLYVYMGSASFRNVALHPNP
jgi:serine/threonine-protein kinase